MAYQKLDVPGGNVVILPAPNLFYSPDYLFDTLSRETPWEQRSVTIYGVERPQPRLICWYGEHSYKYSGLLLRPRAFTPLLDDLRVIMGHLTGTDYNGILINLYPDGQSSIGMHADDEPEFGENPTITSLSLGAVRMFDLQIKDKSLPIVRTPLTHGSVLIMSGETQRFWKHGIAKTKDSVGPRINLTFRKIL